MADKGGSKSRMVWFLAGEKSRFCFCKFVEFLVVWMFFFVDRFNGLWWFEKRFSMALSGVHSGFNGS